jgi:uncharacterized protein YdaT
MPWSMGDAPLNTKKANTPAKKRQWSSIANKVLAQSGDEAKAIKIASAAVKKTPAKKKSAKKGSK